MIIIKNTPYTKAQLAEMSVPTDPNAPEVITHQFYDTQSCLTGQTQPLTFFVAPQTDITMGNFTGPGQLPDPQYFMIEYANFDMLALPAVTATASEPNTAATDLAQLLWQARGVVLLNIAEKNYGPWPLSSFCGTGGVTGEGYGFGTSASGSDVFVANNGAFGTGGFPICGSVIIPPKVNFKWQVIFSGASPAGPTLSATRLVRLSMTGSWYRKVT